MYSRIPLDSREVARPSVSLRRSSPVGGLEGWQAGVCLLIVRCPEHSREKHWLENERMYDKKNDEKNEKSSKIEIKLGGV